MLSFHKNRRLFFLFSEFFQPPKRLRFLSEMSEEKIYIYLMLAKDPYSPHYLVKVGKSQNCDSRLKQHQTGNPYELLLVGKRRLSPSKEIEYHRRLADFRTSGGREWFELSEEKYRELESEFLSPRKPGWRKVSKKKGEYEYVEKLESYSWRICILY